MLQAATIIKMIKTVETEFSVKPCENNESQSETDKNVIDTEKRYKTPVQDQTKNNIIDINLL